MSSDSNKVIYLKRPKKFTLEQAKALISKVKKVTEEAVEEVTPLMNELQQDSLDRFEKEELVQNLQERIDEWSDEIVELGALTKGLWLVDFDSGSGYYCWQYGEDDISFFHGYDEGFSRRIPIQ